MSFVASLDQPKDMKREERFDFVSLNHKDKNGICQGQKFSELCVDACRVGIQVAHLITYNFL